jgi:hypothetical protein
MKMLMIMVALVTAGCAGFFPNASMMTPAQIHESIKIKDTNVACFAGTYAGARVNMLLVNNDKGVPVGMIVDADCKATFNSELQMKKP